MSQWVSWVRRMLGRGVWGALHSVHPALCLLLEMVHFSNLTCQMSLGCPQIWEGGQGEACGEGPAAVVRHHWVSNRNRHTIHALQGCLQQEEQPAKSRHHQIQQSVHRDSRIHKQRWGVAHFYNINITLNDFLVPIFNFSVLSSNQVAVCNLASIALNMYVTPDHTYDFNKLASVTKVIVKNLNKIIDINYYPVPEVCPLLLCWTSAVLELVCVTLQVVHLLLCRLKGQTCDTGQLE